jgi:hypothetical protein
LSTEEVGTNHDHAVICFQNKTWVKYPGGGIRIVSGPSGVFLLNRDKKPFKLNGNGWEQLPGELNDIAVDPKDGKIWALNNKHIGNKGDWEVCYWNGVDGWATDPNAGGVRIVAGPSSLVVLNASHEIFCRIDVSKWERIGGFANDITVADGVLWCIGMDSMCTSIDTIAYMADYGIHRWDGQRWHKEDRAGGQRISCFGPVPFIVNAQGDSWVRGPKQWERITSYSPTIQLLSTNVASPRVEGFHIEIFHIEVNTSRERGERENVKETPGSSLPPGYGPDRTAPPLGGTNTGGGTTTGGTNTGGRPGGTSTGGRPAGTNGGGSGGGGGGTAGGKAK